MGNMTQEEIEALMNGMSGGGSDDASSETSAPGSTESPSDSGGSPEGGSIDEYIPNEAEMGILGEIYNISMGAAATAVSSLLSMKVDITAPSVEIVDGERLTYQPFEPAVGVEIKYVVGIEGINVFILSQLDVMKIVDILLGGTGIVDETAEFNDMHMSAIGEVMNQMMGQSSMSLANFLNTLIDISVPVTYKIEGDFAPAKKEMQGKIIATRFKFIVGDIINSEMLTTCSMRFAKSMIEMAKKAFGMTDSANNTKVQQIIAAEIAPEPGVPQPQSSTAHAPPPEAAPQQPAPNPYYGVPQQTQYPQNNYNMAPPQAQYPQYNVNAQPAAFQNFDAQNGFMGPDAENSGRLRNVPVDVTVEIGKTKKIVSEILEFGEGSIIELDRQSAEPVDIFVNGVLFARGVVVVIEENFGVKITEIL